MRVREAAALVGVVTATVGSLEAASEFNADAAARASAVTIQTCSLGFDVQPGAENHGGLAPSVPGLVDGESDPSTELVSFPMGRPGASWVISKETLRCIREGAWIPGGEPVSTAGIRPGDSERLLRGYAELEITKGKNFDPSSTLISSVAAALVSATLLGYLEGRRRRDGDEEDSAPSDPSDT